VEPTALLRSYFAAWKAADGEALVALLAEDVDAAGPLAAVHGAEAHAASLARSAVLFQDIVVERSVADGDDVLTWFTLRLQDGTDVAAANWCRVRDGRIARVRVTFDPRPMLPA